MAKSSCLICEVRILRLRHGTSIPRVCQLLMSIPFPAFSLRTWSFFTCAKMILNSTYPTSTSAINHGSWRSQRVVVRSLIYSDPVLSTSNIPTGLPAFPFRGVPSPFIPRHSSLVFHPTEMLYALGGPDGTGKSTSSSFLLVFVILNGNMGKKNSTNHGLQSSLKSIAVIPIIIQHTIDFTNDVICHIWRIRQHHTY
jgi:hypothetical protein